MVNDFRNSNQDKMKRKFNITPPDQIIGKALQEKINSLAKPKGSLGKLEEIALKIGLMQQSLNPVLRHPCNVLFGGDHGITDEGVTVSPKEVTLQQMLNFEKGGAGINFLCRQHGFELILVDSGVDGEFPAGSGIIDKKIARGTKNFIKEDAMTPTEFEACIEHGAEIVDMVFDKGSNIISFGEMGSGNTSPSSIWVSILADIPLRDCVGNGANGNSVPAWLSHKLNILDKAIKFHSGRINKSGENLAEAVMRTYGGFEMVMAVGAMLRAAELKMTIIVDGFIMGACMLAASRLYPAVLDYSIFGHCGSEKGHKILLEKLNASPILNLDLRLGEGTGAVCSYPIIDSAVRMINEMSDFESASITKYF